MERCRPQNRYARRSRPSSTRSCARTSSSSGMVRSIDFFEDGPGRRRRLADDRRLPDPLALRERRSLTPVGALEGVHRGQRRLRRALRRRRSRRSQQRLGARAGCPRARSRRSSNVICVGSGKGGVGKSTVTANLAAALDAEGKQRGRPRRRRLGLLDPAHARRPRQADGLAERKILPLEAHGGIKVMSIEFFLEGRTRPSSGAGRCSTRRSASSSRTSSGASSTTC